MHEGDDQQQHDDVGDDCKDTQPQGYRNELRLEDDLAADVLQTVGTAHRDGTEWGLYYCSP